MPSSPRSGSLQHPINAHQTQLLDDQLDTLFRELAELADIFDLAVKKGDIVVRGENGWVRVPAAASDDLVLTSRKSAAGGVVWAEASGGGGATSGGDRRYWFAGLAYGAL